MRNPSVAIHHPQLTSPQEQIIDSFFDTMEQFLDFGEALRPLERRNVIKLVRQNLIFVREGMEAIDEIPELLPVYTNGPTIKERFDLHEQLRLLEDKTGAFLEKVRDLRYVLGNQCWEDGMMIYDASKLASKNRVPKADYYYERMKVRFQKQGNFRSKKQEDEEQGKIENEDPKRAEVETAEVVWVEDAVIVEDSDSPQ